MATLTAPDSSSGDPRRFRRAQWRMLLATMFCYLFFYTGRQTFGFAIPGIQAEFGVSKEDLGWVSALALWAYAGGQFINGNLGDKFGGRRMMSLGAVLSCGMNWVLSFTQGVRSLGGSWLVNYYFQSMAWAPGSRLLSNWWGHHERGKVYGCYVFAAGMASTLAFAMSLLVIDTWALDWRWIFRLPVLLLLLGGVTYYLVVRERPEEMGFSSPHDDLADPDEDAEAELAEDIEESSLQRYLAIGKNWRVWVTGLVIAFQNAARYGLIVWVPVHFLGKSFKTSADSPIDPKWITIALPIGMAIGALSNGLISDKVFKSRRSITIFIYMVLGALTATSMLAIPADQHLLGVAMLFLAGLFVYGPAASIWALCPDLVGHRRAGTATGVVNFCAYVGAGLGEPLIGSVMDALEKYQADPASIGDGAWASFIQTIAQALGDNPATAAVFVIVAVFCSLAAAISLCIRR